VSSASVRAGNETLGSIGLGAVVLAGAASGDTPELVDRMADKLLALRYFRDSQGLTNLDIVDAGGAYLVVSQFTLLADIRRGRRPGFTTAAPPGVAEPLIDRLLDRLAASGVEVAGGRFGADMEVKLVNDGPFTLIVDSERDLARRDET
jgi:D-tyrosyl-tRNA(Tyr) deacylase